MVYDLTEEGQTSARMADKAMSVVIQYYESICDFDAIAQLEEYQADIREGIESDE